MYLIFWIVQSGWLVGFVLLASPLAGDDACFNLQYSAERTSSRRRMRLLPEQLDYTVAGWWFQTVNGSWWSPLTEILCCWVSHQPDYSTSLVQGEFSLRKQGNCRILRSLFRRPSQQISERVCWSWLFGVTDGYRVHFGIPIMCQETTPPKQKKVTTCECIGFCDLKILISRSLRGDIARCT